MKEREPSVLELKTDNDWRQPLSRFAVFAVVLSLLFIKPLIDLVGLALRQDLFSHIPLIPCIAAYLIWLRRAQLRQALVLDRKTENGKRKAEMGKAWLVPAVLGLIALGFYWFGPRKMAGLPVVDYLAPVMFAYVCWLIGGGLAWFGWPTIRRVLFPVLFLIFMVPFPTALTNAIEMFFQYLSADASAVLFAMTGVPVLRDGLIFELPGITLQVAEECSGIRSSLVLFITSLLAGYLFLRSPGKRVILALAVIPLGIVRNGFRIVTIGLLCVHVSPDMIHSPIHHRGGPLFFVLSLVPFFLLLWWMRRMEARGASSGDGRSEMGDGGVGTRAEGAVVPSSKFQVPGSRFKK